MIHVTYHTDRRTNTDFFNSIPKNSKHNPVMQNRTLLSNLLLEYRTNLNLSCLITKIFAIDIEACTTSTIESNQK